MSETIEITKSSSECITCYEKFIESGNKEDLDTCLKYFDEIIGDYDNIFSFDLEEVNLGKCMILNKKLRDKYIHTYDPSNIVKKIIEQRNDLPSDYYCNFMEMYDITPRTNCCNCVSVVLYSNKDSYKLSAYLTNILITLENIEKHLTDWILRLYLDTNIFETIYKEEHETTGEKKSCDPMNLGCEYRKMLNYINKHSNCEIYLSFCKKIYETDFSMSKLRTQRYWCFVDQEVNVCASREADGFVTSFDAHNLKTLENSDMIFFTYPFNYGAGFEYLFSKGKDIMCLINNAESKKIYSNTYFTKKGAKNYDSEIVGIQDEYAKWHNNYKFYNYYFESEEKKLKGDTEKTYYEAHSMLLPILAGLFALKCKYKKEFYVKQVNKLDTFYKNFLEVFGNRILRFKYTTVDHANTYSALKTGYDELLLMLLIEPIFGSSYKIVVKDFYEYAIFKNANSILNFIGLSIPNSLISNLKYTNSIDLSTQINSTVLNTQHDEALQNNYNIANFSLTKSYNEYLSVSKLMQFDKINYSYYEEHCKNKFVYPTKYFMNLLNYGTQHITPMITTGLTNFNEYLWFIKYYNINLNESEDIYKKKYLKYKKKYISLKQT